MIRGAHFRGDLPLSSLPTGTADYIEVGIGPRHRTGARGERQGLITKMNANMKRRFVFCLGAMLFAGTLAAQTPVPEWQAWVDKVKSLIKTNPEQASDAAGELLKGKNKKNVELVIPWRCLSGM